MPRVKLLWNSERCRQHKAYLLRIRCVDWPSFFVAPCSLKHVYSGRVLGCEMFQWFDHSVMLDVRSPCRIGSLTGQKCWRGWQLWKVWAWTAIHEPSNGVIAISVDRITTVTWSRWTIDWMIDYTPHWCRRCWSWINTELCQFSSCRSVVHRCCSASQLQNLAL